MLKDERAEADHMGAPDSLPPPQLGEIRADHFGPFFGSAQKTLARRAPVGTGSSQSQHPQHARHTENNTAFVIASAADKIVPKVAEPRAI